MSDHKAVLGSAAWVQRTHGRMTAAERRSLVRPLARTHLSNAVGRLRMAVRLHPGRNVYIPESRLAVPETALTRAARGVTVTQDDLLYRVRLAGELGNVRAACRAMGIHPSTYYRWKRQLDRHGPEILRPRERRVPLMANQTSVLVEQRVVASPLAHPGLAQPGSLPSSLNPAGVLSACQPMACGGCCAATAELVQLDCFCIGRLSGTKGTIWQYTAIDVASAYTWATLQVTRRNPSPAGPVPWPARSPPSWPLVAGSWSGS
jgi:transposase-like protein